MANENICSIQSYTILKRIASKNLFERRFAVPKSVLCKKSCLLTLNPASFPNEKALFSCPKEVRTRRDSVTIHSISMSEGR